MKYLKAMALMLCLACNSSNDNEENNDTIKDYDTRTPALPNLYQAAMKV